MNDLKEKLEKKIRKYHGQALWDEVYCDFEQVVAECLEEMHIDIPLSRLDLLEESEGVSEEGKPTRFAKVRITHTSLLLHVYAIKEKKWDFYFDKVEEMKESHSLIQVDKQRILNINGKDCVLVMFNPTWKDIELFAVPVNVAERLGVEGLNGVEITTEEQIEFIESLHQYRLFDPIYFWQEG